MARIAFYRSGSRLELAPRYVRTYVQYLGTYGKYRTYMYILKVGRGVCPLFCFVYRKFSLCGTSTYIGIVPLVSYLYRPLANYFPACECSFWRLTATRAVQHSSELQRRVDRPAQHSQLDPLRCSRARIRQRRHAAAIPCAATTRGCNLAQRA